MLHQRQLSTFLTLLLSLPGIAQEPGPDDAPDPKREQASKQEQRQAPSAFQDIKLDEALLLAKELGRPVLVAFFHGEDDRSVRYSEQHWDSPTFQEWAARKTVALRVDVSKRDSQSRRMGIRYYPTTLLLSPEDGQEIDRLEGPVPSSELPLALEALLLGRLGKPERPTEETAKDPMAWLAWGNHCFATGEVNDAVEAYMWCFDHAETYLPGFLDRYLDFVLRRTREMNLATPLAKTSLQSRREQLLEKLRNAKASDREAYVFTRLGYWLNREQDTVAVYDELANGNERQQELRQVIFRQLLERLVRERRYRDVARTVGNPKEEIIERLERYNEDLAAQNESEVEMDPLIAAHLREDRGAIVRDGVLFYETLLGIGQGKDAAEVADLLVALKPNGRTYADLVAAAHRVELPELANELGQRGIEENGDDPRALRQISRALNNARGIGVKRLDATEIERRKQKRTPDEGEQDGDGNR